MGKEWHPVPSLVFRALLAAHAGIEYFRAGGRAIVYGEDKERVRREAEFVQEFPQAADIVVDVGDHGVKRPPRWLGRSSKV